MEEASITIDLPREFWNVSVLLMSSEILCRAGQTSYSRSATDYLMLNDVRNKGRVHYENSKRIKVSGKTSSCGRDGQGNIFTAEASGDKLAADEIPIHFVARAYSRML